jgi:hypothetical protein
MIEVVEVLGWRLFEANWLASWPHTWQVNGQSLLKCVGVSGAALHSWHKRLLGQPLFSRLLDVRIFLCKRIQAKILHLGSDFAFQIGQLFFYVNGPTKRHKSFTIIFLDSHVQQSRLQLLFPPEEERKKEKGDPKWLGQTQETNGVVQKKREKRRKKLTTPAVSSILLHSLPLHTSERTGGD